MSLLSVQIEQSRITFEHLKYEDEIRDLKDNIKIAKNLGILGNNFNNFIPDGSSFIERSLKTKKSMQLFTSLERVKGKHNITWPTWYLYGQRALEHEIEFDGASRCL